MKKKYGQSVVEVILAASLFMFFSASAIGLVLQGMRSNQLGTEETIATQYNTQALEAVHSIKNQAFSNLTNTSGIGISKTADVWVFSGTNNVFDKYTRSIGITDVFRDVSGNIVSSGGTIDPLTKKIIATTSWNFNAARSNSVVLSTYLSDWRKSFAKGGMLVYGNGGTTNDAIAYKTFDGTSWSTAGSLADIDTGSTNKYLRAVKVFSSPLTNEKIVVSRHYNGSSQFIYAQVFNGTTWGSVQLLSSWAATTFLDVQQFDGAYINNGNFAVFYGDNTTTPKYRVWTSGAWAGPYNLPVSGIPNFIVAKTRPNTKEIMVSLFGQNNGTYTYYFNGVDLSVVSNWTMTTHSTVSPVNTKRIISFDWSPNNPLQGALVYPDSSTDRAITDKIFTANGSGGGSWSSAANSANIGSGTNRLGALSVESRNGANEFISCTKDSTNNIGCFESSNVPAWTTPTNTVISTTQTGIQRSYHFGYENSGAGGLIVYSDNTTIAKAKKYDPSTNTFDASATTVGTLNNTTATVRLIPSTTSDDILVLLSSAVSNLYSVFWNGSTNAFYTTGGQSFTNQSTNGSASTDFWYDFTWD
jgi:hypothetical protein